MFSFAFFFFFFLYKKIFALSLSKKRGKKALELRERNFLSLSVSGTNKGESRKKIPRIKVTDVASNKFLIMT